MTDASNSVFPRLNGTDYWSVGGLTKREYFAAMAMQGWLASRFWEFVDNPPAGQDFDAEIAAMARRQADALMAELGEE